MKKIHQAALFWGKGGACFLIQAKENETNAARTNP
jgi:hypothetical protein